MDVVDGRGPVLLGVVPLALAPAEKARSAGGGKGTSAGRGLDEPRWPSESLRGVPVAVDALPEGLPLPTRLSVVVSLGVVAALPSLLGDLLGSVPEAARFEVTCSASGTNTGMAGTAGGVASSASLGALPKSEFEAAILGALIFFAVFDRLPGDRWTPSAAGARFLGVDWSSYSSWMVWRCGFEAAGTRAGAGGGGIAAASRAVFVLSRSGSATAAGGVGRSGTPAAAAAFDWERVTGGGEVGVAYVGVAL